MTIVTKAATKDYLSGHDRIWGSKKNSLIDFKVVCDASNQDPLDTAPQPVRLGTKVIIDGVPKVFTEQEWVPSKKEEVTSFGGPSKTITLRTEDILPLPTSAEDGVTKSLDD